MKKSGKDRLKCAVYESTLSTADAVPLPQWGRLRYESTAIPISSERIHACVEKQYPRQSLPRVGKVASEASRIGQWRYERAREIVSSAPLYESTRASLRGPPSPMGKATIREHRYPHIVRANTCMCEKTIPPTKPSPCGEGGEQSEPDRVLAV